MMKKTIIITILITLLVEAIILVIWWFLAYHFYDKLTASESWISDKITQKELKEIEWNFEDIENTFTWSYYNGIFGKIELNEETIEDLKAFSKEKFSRYEINFEEINKQVILRKLSDNDLLDKYLYTWLVNSSNLKEDISNLLSFEMILWILSKEKQEQIIDEIEIEEEQVKKTLIPLVKLNNYEKLSEYLFNLEANLTQNTALLPDNIISSNSLINDENFQYIISKLFSEDYYKNIKSVSLETKIDEKLLISAIWVEQLRYLTTNRWYAKDLIKQNKLLTNFSKFSYWLGGIKIDTFKTINTDLQEYDIDFYEKYLKQYDEQAKINWVYSDYEIQKILEDEYSWILYSAWLIHSIKKKWELAWFPIDENYWIIITLYNMWNKKDPHSTPDVWGSSISVTNWNTYYFWELWLVIYEYLKYYL